MECDSISLPLNSVQLSRYVVRNVPPRVTSHSLIASISFLDVRSHIPVEHIPNIRLESSKNVRRSRSVLQFQLSLHLTVRIFR